MSRTTRYLTYKGETKPLKYWSQKTGIGYMTLWYRLNTLNMNGDDAIDTPLKKKAKNLYKGQYYTNEELAGLNGTISAETVKVRRRRGWSTQQIVETPKRYYKAQKQFCKYECLECPYPDCVR